MGYPLGKDLNGAFILAETFVEYFPKDILGHINLWCRGSSGAIMATAFAMKDKMHTFNICHVKKEGEKSHETYTRYEVSGINVIIDDFICSGETIDYIISYMRSLDILPTILMVSSGANDYRSKDLFKYIISA